MDIHLNQVVQLQKAKEANIAENTADKYLKLYEEEKSIIISYIEAGLTTMSIPKKPINTAIHL